MSEAAATVSPIRPAPSRVRVVTAASLFDGHDAAINIMRRILQAQGAEVIHLGHDRSVNEVVEAAIQEDAHAVAISSYQGGHVEFFKYLVDCLKERGAPNIRVYGGGGGTIVPEEIEELHSYGVARIFSPDDGRELGLEGMIKIIVDECTERTITKVGTEIEEASPSDHLSVARLITWFEENGDDETTSEMLRQRLLTKRGSAPAPVVGFTGTGGAGKSSVVDELVRRFRLENSAQTIGLLLMDPTRRRSGGALLGDRIRMNAIHGDNIFVRSLATRTAHRALSKSISDAVGVLQGCGFDLILVETAGIGQSDSEITDLVDTSIYVMTPEYGAPSQLEKIDMLELADVIVLNKFDRHGADDALRDVRKQWKRNHPELATLSNREVPVFPTMARAWNDPGVERLFKALLKKIEGGLATGSSDLTVAQDTSSMIPPSRGRYLAEISEGLRKYHSRTEEMSNAASRAWGIRSSLEALDEMLPDQGELFSQDSLIGEDDDSTLTSLRKSYNECIENLDKDSKLTIAEWDGRASQYADKTQSYRVRGKEISVDNFVESISGNEIPKVAFPVAKDWGERIRFGRLENVPGKFPFTAGVFPFKREGEDPTRMFAGEGTPERTNRRFHYLCEGQPAARLSTAFDSVTLYGRDPDERPDIYGKVGNSGVSVCSLDDAKKLYSGFDLCDPKTSVSMTINGPAPMVLAFFLNAATDQQIEKHLLEVGGLEDARRKFRSDRLPEYKGVLPDNHDQLGLRLLGIPGDSVVSPEIYDRVKSYVLKTVRGTVQADILKEDQAQNTCIFSTEFALKMMGDIQEYFTEKEVQNFYSVSISGYHIAEAGANPISQLAFTLANGFTYAEYYLSRGMSIDDFAGNFSFFFSNGLDPEYNVIGRVARRIWAVTMKERYGASSVSQKLKYHIQTSGRSLHAQEMSFNDIRTTLQALIAIQDHCNSLHTNAYDEAVTTPTPESVRRALAIQLIINRELGTTINENPIQGSYFIDQLTDLVEEAVLKEFDRISERGGVLGAMETHYQRGKIQEESMHYETLKHSGELPIIGVNSFIGEQDESAPSGPVDLMRATEDEKHSQLESLHGLWVRNEESAKEGLKKLQTVARSGGNVFEELMETVKVASLGQISNALFEVGGRYRRAM